jgi:Zn-dependent protease with chaperone function
MKKLHLLLFLSSFIAIFVIAKQFIGHNAGNQPPKTANATISINPSLVKSFNLDSLDVEKAHSKEFYQQWLNEQEAILWQELEGVFGITKEQAEEYKKAWYPEYLKMVEEMIKEDRVADQPREENKKLINSILTDLGIDPATIAIIPWNKQVAGGSFDQTIFINETILAQMPSLVQKFIIGHEIMHIVHKDHSTSFVLAQMRAINKIEDSPVLTQALQHFGYFKEIRADLEIMLRGKEYVQGEVKLMERSLQATNGVEKESPTHPSNSLRYKLGNHLLIA